MKGFVGKYFGILILNNVKCVVLWCFGFYFGIFSLWKSIFVYSWRVISMLKGI